MAKDSFYFSHDYNARNDEKILELRSDYGAEGYGVFWMLVETMAENENGGIKASLIGGLSLAYGVAKERLLVIISKCIEIELFYENGGNYFSKRLLSHKEYRAELSRAGADGAKKRWGGYSPPNAKERKGKERKGNIERYTPVGSNLEKSNLFRKPKIPSREQVDEVFKRSGGTGEMAKSFFEKYEGTEWFLNGSPVTNFVPLANKFISNWNKNNEKRTKPISSGDGRTIEFDQP